MTLICHVCKKNITETDQMVVVGSCISGRTNGEVTEIPIHVNFRLDNITKDNFHQRIKTSHIDCFNEICGDDWRME